MKRSCVGLELYAKIEPLLGFEDEAERLYELYIEILKSWRPETLIDIGCGSGKFLSFVKESLAAKRVFGVDLSETMVSRAKKRGVEAEVLDICALDESFEAATAVFDVLNYLDENGLRRFMGCVEEILRPGGIFIADINTLYGFEELSPGALVRESQEGFLVLDSEFEEGRLETSIDFFQEDEKGCYRREHDTILQYYHTVESIAGASGLELIQVYPVALYSDVADKEVLLLQKRE